MRDAVGGTLRRGEGAAEESDVNGEIRGIGDAKVIRGGGGTGSAARSLKGGTGF